MRYLGLDVGQKTIGLAVGETLASELTTLRVSKEEKFYQDPAKTRAYEQIDRIMKEESANQVVIGLPVDEAGKLTPEATKIKDFGQGLEKAIGRPVHYTDETLTSFMAMDILDSLGVVGNEAEERVDQVSAQLILQQFLEETALDPGGE